MMTLTPAPCSSFRSGWRSRRSTIAKAARPRYASVLPPPVGKKSRSTVSRSGSRGSARPGTFSRMKASWKARQRGGPSAKRSGKRCRRARATARFATRNASRAAASDASMAIPRSIRSAATPARRKSSAAVSGRAPMGFECAESALPRSPVDQIGDADPLILLSEELDPIVAYTLMYLCAKRLCARVIPRPGWSGLRSLPVRISYPGPTRVPSCYCSTNCRFP